MHTSNNVRLLAALALTLPVLDAAASTGYYPMPMGGYGYPPWQAPPMARYRTPAAPPRAYAQPYAAPRQGYPWGYPVPARPVMPRTHQTQPAKPVTAAPVVISKPAPTLEPSTDAQQPTSVTVTPKTHPKARLAKAAPITATPVQKPATTAGPTLSVKLPTDFAETAQGVHRKARFLDLVAPLVEQENSRILADRQRMLELLRQRDAGTALADDDGRWLQALARRYRVDGQPLETKDVRHALRRNVDTVPTSLALAQAANESAWGSSRFAREGQNLFGIWTYDASKGIVPKQRSPGKKHLVRRFDDLNESVRYYLHTLNSHPAYAKLRELRATARQQGEAPNGALLAEGLEKYSAKGMTYVRIIQAMIEDNGLTVYDGVTLARR